MKSNGKLDNILQEFLKITEIPRPSHHEEKIGAYLVSWAQARGLCVTQDDLGNVIIDKPASPGAEHTPRVILQAHMDMVCVASEGTTFDPQNDPIKIINDGKTLRAKGTSLGADDGIGIALCQQILQDDSLQHGPLRVIITVNEEDGMDSINMSSDFLCGDYLINLDWESLGSLCNSAAGCDFAELSRDATLEDVPDSYASLNLTIKGLQGGHSGVGINLGRANALVCMATFIIRLVEDGIPILLSDFSGGQAKNAIPATAQATIAFPQEYSDKINEAFDTYKKDFVNTFGPIEITSEFFSDSGEHICKVLDDDSMQGLLAVLTSLPNGVNTMSPFAQNLVESSQNLGVLSIEDGHIRLEIMARSCVPYRAEEILRASRLTAKAFGFTYTQGDHAPAWAVNPDSRLVPIACEAYRTLTGKEMVVEPVHGGLECGAFYEKNPHLDMIAIGPTLTDVHTPDEACDIESISVTYELLVDILLRISQLPD